MLMNSLAAMCAGFAINILFGDPPNGISLRNVIPRFAKLVERRLKKHYKNSAEAHRFAGFVLLLLCLIIFALIPSLAVWLTYKHAPVISFIIECLLCWSAFSVMHTKIELDRMRRQLKIGRIDLARTSLSKLLGTDCSDMNEQALIRRAVECAADTAADNGAGVLFWAALFGGPGAVFFRTASLLRRTYSGRGEQSLDFGIAAYRLWMIMDFVPAFICGALSNFAAAILGLYTSECFDVYRRDRKKLASPNLAPCRCVLASALGITLTPKSFLRNGKVIFITVGDDRREPHFDDPETAAAVMFSAVSFTMLLFFALKLLFIILVG